MYSVFKNTSKVAITLPTLNSQIGEWLKMRDELHEEPLAEEAEVYQGANGVEQTHCRNRQTKRWVDHEKKRNRRKAAKQSRKKNRR